MGLFILFLPKINVAFLMSKTGDKLGSGELIFTSIVKDFCFGRFPSLLVSLILDATNLGVGKNDGRPDAFVSPNEFFKFSEYQFSVDNLEQFTGFIIKVVMISTNESYPVFIKDFRAIALA